MKEWPTSNLARDLAGGKVFPASEAIILQTGRKHGSKPVPVKIVALRTTLAVGGILAV